MMFGDNESAVNTASMSQGKLHKGNNALSFHKTRDAIATGIVRFHHVAGNKNPADVVSKHWDFPSVKPLLRPLLFWEGDTAKIKAYDLAKHGEPKVPKAHRQTIHDEVDL